MKKLIKRIMLGISSLLILFSLYKFVHYEIDKHNSSNLYQKLEDSYVINKKNIYNYEKNEYIKENNMYIDFDSLKEINPNICAWIESENGDINYPIVKSSDNSYYLSHAFDNSENNHGTIFADYRNSKDFSDDVTMIYGHNMKDNTMFGTIDNFRKTKSYYKTNNTMYIYTKTDVYKIKIFAGAVLNGNYVFVGNYKNKSQFNTNMQQIKDNATFTTNIDVNYGDKVVGLYTCSYDYSDSKYIVFGVVQNDMKVKILKR